MFKHIFFKNVLHSKNTVSAFMYAQRIIQKTLTPVNTIILFL